MKTNRTFRLDRLYFQFLKPKSQFGKYNKIAVHQVVEDIENDVSNALHSFHRDGFGNIVFYVGV